MQIEMFHHLLREHNKASTRGTTIPIAEATLTVSKETVYHILLFRIGTIIPQLRRKRIAELEIAPNKELPIILVCAKIRILPLYLCEFY